MIRNIYKLLYASSLPFLAQCCPRDLVFGGDKGTALETSVGHTFGTYQRKDPPSTIQDEISGKFFPVYTRVDEFGSVYYLYKLTSPSIWLLGFVLGANSGYAFFEPDTICPEDTTANYFASAGSFVPSESGTWAISCLAGGHNGLVEATFENI